MAGGNQHSWGFTPASPGHFLLGKSNLINTSSLNPDCMHAVNNTEYLCNYRFGTNASHYMFSTHLSLYHYIIQWIPNVQVGGGYKTHNCFLLMHVGKNTELTFNIYGTCIKPNSSCLVHAQLKIKLWQMRCRSTIYTWADL